jgi:hypothetical protein
LFFDSDESLSLIVSKDFTTDRGTHTENGTVIKVKGGGKVFSTQNEYS